MLGLPNMVRGQILRVGREDGDRLALPDIAEARAQASLSPAMSYAASENYYPGAYMVVYRIEDLYDLVPSHTDMSAADQERIAEMARTLPVEALVEDSLKLRTGAPIIGGDRMIESGNGWVRALRVAQRDAPAKWREYYAAVDQQAAEMNLHDQIDAARNPVLVRERLTPVPNRADFMAEANVDSDIGFRPTDELVEVEREEGEQVSRVKPVLLTTETIERMKSEGRKGRRRRTRKALYDLDDLLPEFVEETPEPKPSHQRSRRSRATTGASLKSPEAVKVARPKSKRERRPAKPTVAPPYGPEPKPPASDTSVLPPEVVGPSRVNEPRKERKPEMQVEAGSPLVFFAGEDVQLPSVKEARREAADDAPLTYAFSERFPKFAYMLRYRVVDLDDLITSHNAIDLDLIPNPAFPKEIQPRIRERLGSRAQVWKIAKELIPERLTGETNQLRAGAPIIGGDLMVESGNGRILALRMARGQMPDSWQEYKEEVELRAAELGIADQLEGVDDPVLVRDRLTPVNRVSFAREANDDETLTLSPVETALKEADAIPNHVLEALDSFEGEEADTSIDAMFRSPRMRSAVMAYIKELPPNTWNELVTKDGTLNRQGKQRFKAALFAKVYDGENGVRLAETFLEDDEGSKNIENALFNTLRQTAEVKAGIRRGRLPDEVDLSEDIIKVVDKLMELRAHSMTVGPVPSPGWPAGRSVRGGPHTAPTGLTGLHRREQEVGQADQADHVRVRGAGEQGLATRPGRHVRPHRARDEREAVCRGPRRRQGRPVWRGGSPRDGAPEGVSEERVLRGPRVRQGQRHDHRAVCGTAGGHRPRIGLREAGGRVLRQP